MKKKLFITLCLMIALITFVFIQIKQLTISNTESITHENISLAVYKSSDYTSDAYKNALAQLHVTIQDGNNKVVWEKTFNSKYLSQYPSLEDAVKQNLDIRNILLKDEQLIVKYDITYNSQGSELQIKNEVALNDTSNLVSISI